ncbi:MAG: hypothetical protein ACI8UO_002115 [Verrucomicrobiales bacterium]|jgi:hypothetical protein
MKTANLLKCLGIGLAIAISSCSPRDDDETGSGGGGNGGGGDGGSSSSADAGGGTSSGGGDSVGDDKRSVREVVELNLKVDVKSGEPTGQNSDHFISLSECFAYLNHLEPDEAQMDETAGSMMIKLLGRAPGSDQAPLELVENLFPMHTGSYFEPNDNKIHITISPEDVVRYRLISTGQMYGEGSVLVHMFKHSKCEDPAISGTVDSFTMPYNVEIPTVYEFKVETPRETKSWFDGTITVTIASRWFETWDKSKETWIQDPDSREPR